MNRLLYSWGAVPLVIGLAACQPQDPGTDQVAEAPGDMTLAVEESPRAPVAWSCDGLFVLGKFSGDTLMLSQGNQNDTLKQAMSGSGARYTSEDEPPTTVFWIKGNTANYENDDAEPRHCYVIDDPNNPESSVLAGSWKVSQIDGSDVVAGSSVTIVVGPNRQLSGSNGCNTYRGQFKVGADGIEIGPMATTMMACPENIMKQEQLFGGILSQVITVAFKGEDAVAFSDPGGRVILADRVD